MLKYQSAAQAGGPGRRLAPQHTAHGSQRGAVPYALYNTTLDIRGERAPGPARVCTVKQMSECRRSADHSGYNDFDVAMSSRAELRSGLPRAPPSPARRDSRGVATPPGSQDVARGMPHRNIHAEFNQCYYEYN
ncbi:unnamed protein product [Chrysodeixis includens]|uniref:Uncharacterized protein n=1 Tax=Chrysodeixis includens TaxID=689277 RepID=A0A9N8KTW6_CHRIL|nr:unnamed protein product [Chrysodeixis includens]